jgi:hypothetical protein
MRTKTRREVIPVVFLVLVLATAYGTSVVYSVDSSIWRVEAGQSAQWLVMASSNVTAEWYSETFTFVGRYHVPVGSTINFTVTSVVGSQCRGDISVGNLSIRDVSTGETSDNLALGMWPFRSGLVSPVNWDVQKQNATDLGYTVNETKLGDNIEVVTFKYLFPGGVGGTILVYDKATGLLISGYGAFGQFLLEVTLISTGIDVGSVQSGYQSLGTAYLMVEIVTMMGAAALIIIFVLASRRTKGGK